MGSSPHVAGLVPPGCADVTARGELRAQGDAQSRHRPHDDATQMRSRLSIDGAITAYRDGRTAETLEASESRRLQLHEGVFDNCEAGKREADFCKQPGADSRPAAAIRR